MGGKQRKWKRSDSSDSDSAELMTPLTTPYFDFHQVISAFTTPTTTPTPSLVKTSLYARNQKLASKSQSNYAQMCECMRAFENANLVKLLYSKQQRKTLKTNMFGLIKIGNLIQAIKLPS